MMEIDAVEEKNKSYKRKLDVVEETASCDI
jgi:hypothetical protein